MNPRDTAPKDGPLEEEPLRGGKNATEVVRVGGTVRRTREPGSGYTARLLAYLEATRYPYAPRYLGVDERGRDVLTFIPGEVSRHPGERAEDAYARGGEMLRRLHDATAGHPLAAGGDCVLHGDPGPFNTIFDGGLPVAFIDWWSCRPGTPLEDLGYMAWTWCLQCEETRSADAHPDDIVPLETQARHLRALRDGYDPGVEAERLLAAMIRTQDRLVAQETANAGDVRQPVSRRKWAMLAIAWAAGCRALIRRNEALFLGALRA
jgi:hypothetical protein